MKKLRVLARGAAMVFDYERHDAGTRRFVGRRFDGSLGAVFVDESGAQQRQGGWPASHSPANPDEIPHRADYVRALRDGDLWPADAETAAFVGVAFDPTFGGDYPSPRPSSPVVRIESSSTVKE